MEDGAVGHPGHLAVEIVGLKQEEESATNHGPLMEGHFVEDLPMKKQDVICISVQLMEDGAVGHPGLLAVLNVEMELKQEEESVTNHPPLMEGHFVEDLLMKKQDVT